MTLLPAYPETLVLPYKANEIYDRLRAATSNKPFIQPDEKALHFNGWVTPDRFRISRRIHRTNYYVPLITGKIESTSSGSLILLEYRLFPTTRYLMVLWTVLLPICTLVVSKNPWTFLISLAMVGLLYLVVWFNFKMQVTTSQELIHHVVRQSGPLA